MVEFMSFMEREGKGRIVLLVDEHDPDRRVEVKYEFDGEHVQTTMEQMTKPNFLVLVRHIEVLQRQKQHLKEVCAAVNALTENVLGEKQF